MATDEVRVDVGGSRNQGVFGARLVKIENLIFNNGPEVAETAADG